jgi:FtsH-binding integral membrane protein
MAACGAIGALSGRDFSNMGKYLMFGLLALIVVGIVNIFVAFSTGVTIVYCLIGMAIFAGFFIFDFFRISKAENTWFNAITATMQIYLDFINFLLYLLRFLEAVTGNKK